MAAMGRPTLYEPDLCEQAHNYCLLGATNDDLAGFFGVSARTIDRWIADHDDFGDAVKRGRIVADSRVARGLYERAVGYDRTFERTVVVAGELKPVTGTVHYRPSVPACIFWLRNRRRATWSDPGRDSAGNPFNPVAGEIALLDAAGGA